ncbi:GGDEF domain-containing protein [Paucibacter sp. R3-3]|uniref:diguanylate cyclase n=1 Tax=Roseateles agri TaxID=3098619 RepID=A0ABU5DN01_9BURK|nr:GGDEF domain-containing protein [Paucibacter sp. R3-3]MDY0747698.1 GGDEF domain-containing protein [Paucibacter sp. R3-3]
MSEAELGGFRQMQTAFREPLVVPTFLLAVAAMTSFVIWDVAREGGWGLGANLRVACAGIALGLLGLIRGLWSPSIRLQSLSLYFVMYAWQLVAGSTFGSDTLLQFPGLLVIMFASVFAFVHARDAWVNIVLAGISVPLVLPPAASTAQWLFVLGLFASVILLVWVNCAQRERTSAVIFLSKSQWKRDAQTDMLTGLPNRRTFESFMEREAWRLASSPTSLTLAIIDIDHFKMVNDLHGHDAGDGVLKEVADRLSGNLRDVDLLARLGGEEFALVMLGIPREAATALLGRLKNAIESRPLAVGTLGVRCTISAGLATGAVGDESWDALYHRADQALYEAKAGGRNRIVASPLEAGV